MVCWTCCPRSLGLVEKNSPFYMYFDSSVHFYLQLLASLSLVVLKMIECSSAAIFLFPFFIIFGKYSICQFFKVLESLPYYQLFFLYWNFTKWLESVRQVQWSHNVSPIKTVHELCLFFMPSVNHEHWLMYSRSMWMSAMWLVYSLRMKKTSNNSFSCSLSVCISCWNANVNVVFP